MWSSTVSSCADDFCSEEDAATAQAALRAAAEAALATEKSAIATSEVGNDTTIANTTVATAESGSGSGIVSKTGGAKLVGGAAKKKGKPKMSAKEKKERSVSHCQSCFDQHWGELRGNSLQLTRRFPRFRWNLEAMTP